nr:flagellar protein FlaG [Ectothiorhodospira lacustris]
MNPVVSPSVSVSGPGGGNPSPVKAMREGESLPKSDDSEPNSASPEQKAESDIKELTASVDNAVKRINEFVQVVQRDLQFTVDDSTGRTVVRVYDTESEELIRQLPPDEVLAIAAFMDELKGMLVKEKA